jgi:glycosyltransferase involved in cell wall biosynthesis
MALRAAYAEADTLLYPSLAEGFGLPPHEALDHGLLPICADIPSLGPVWATPPFTLTQGTSIHWEETIKKRISGKLDGPRATVREEARMAGSFRTGRRSPG